ncbi:hypothetical protein PaG_03502 [Moesziomyces aphidis]|uniref:Cut9 interacting protein Scn1 n=1 Tax=Moesziomyces aphidis TaxID=84754 RepID=W3VLJ3_MOEAP|nr:hypothetical protein PaG_03502 [Moesziomyces aphidis]
MCAGGSETSMQADLTVEEPPEALAELFVDSHCHPTDDPAAYTEANLDELSRRIQDSAVGKLVCMSTNARDQKLVAELASRHPLKVVPCFGWHPWFAHQISLSDPAPSKRDHYYQLFGLSDGQVDDRGDLRIELDSMWDHLPDPISLRDVCDEIEGNFERFPNALLGEVGIDRAFRIPRRAWNYDPQKTAEDKADQPRLTRLKTPQAHQMSILRAQIEVALRFKRNISLHSVQAAGLTVDLLSSLRNTDLASFGAIRLSLHSCTMDTNVVKSIAKKHANVYVGFSSTINRKQILQKECLAGVDRTRALMESDHHTVRNIPACLLQASRYFADLHGLSLEAAAQQLRSNWNAFYSSTYCQDQDSDTD